MRVVEPFRFDLGFLGSGAGIEVPAGFETDGPSVPFFLLPFLPVGAMYRTAAVHDFLRQATDLPLYVTDLIFAEALGTDGVREPYRTLAYLGVRTNRSRSA